MSSDALEEYARRYGAALHAMQSGVKFEQENGSTDGTPKHLRVGINSALVDNAALTKLLIDKGIITALEYVKALAEGMEAEKARYEALLSMRTGKKVTLA